MWWTIFFIFLGVIVLYIVGSFVVAIYELKSEPGRTEVVSSTGNESLFAQCKNMMRRAASVFSNKNCD